MPYGAKYRPKDRWAVHMCTCNGALPIDAKEIERLAGLNALPHVHENLGNEGAGAYWQDARLGTDFHLICCCSPEGALDPALREAGVEEDQTVRLDVKGGAFWRQESAEEGNRLAARMIRSTIARTEARNSPR